MGQRSTESKPRVQDTPPPLNVLPITALPMNRLRSQDGQVANAITMAKALPIKPLFHHAISIKGSHSKRAYALRMRCSR